MTRTDILSDLLADLRLDNSLYLYARLGHPWALQMPVTPNACFYAITHGQAWVRHGGDQAFLVRAGEVVLFQPGVAHRLDPDLAQRPELTPINPAIAPSCYHQLDVPGGDETRLVFGCCAFGGSFGAALLNSLPDTLHIPNPVPDSPAWLGLIHQLLESRFLNERPGQAAMINRLCEVIWLESLRTHVEQQPTQARGWLRAVRDRYLSPALSHMHQRPSYPWTVPELAQQVGLSRSAFAARFNEVMGETPQAYLTRYRMQLAARELTGSARPVTAIALSVGYGSETAFSLAFKREMGMSPTAWRHAGAPA